MSEKSAQYRDSRIIPNVLGRSHCARINVHVRVYLDGSNASPEGLEQQTGTRGYKHMLNEDCQFAQDLIRYLPITPFPMPLMTPKKHICVSHFGRLAWWEIMAYLQRLERIS